MITIERPKEIPSSLTAVKGRAATERQSVIDWFKTAKPGTKFEGCKFEAYGNDDVRAALTKMSFGKCAYCETVYAATQSTAVEHYRPKNEVVLVDGQTKKKIYPGYPWLAYEWNNLLPSCTDCNSGRYHETEVHDDEQLLGKGNQFPLADERKRARRPGDEKREKPLLLNPCADRNVERYFRFDDNGFVVPAFKTGLAHRRANATIEICGLYRSELVNNRLSKLTYILADIDDFRRAVALANETGSELARQLVASMVSKLQLHLLQKEPYVAMARQYILPVIAPYL